MSQTVWLFIHTRHVGGAEKRFGELWKALQITGGVYNLALTKDLHQKLQADPRLREALEKHNDRVFFLEWKEAEGFRKGYKKFIEQYAKSGDVLHFVGEHPFILSKRYKQIFSITQSSLKNLNLFGRLGHYIGIVYANTVDVLDPVIYKKLLKHFFYKKKQIHRTSNSFCDVELYRVVPFEDKKDWFIFLGRFEPVKQAKQLLQAVPSLYEAMKNVSQKDLHFYFFGHGSQEALLKEMAEQETFRHLPLTICYNDKPAEVLTYGKVFFSLQLHTNYPSRSLIEAMAAGNIPIVTDIGQTRWLAKPEFSYYVPEDFTTSDLVSAVKKLYSENPDALAQKSAQARELIKKEYTVEKMRDYYLDLYKRI